MILVKAVSLFASSGVGDLALRANNIDVIVANELLPERAKLFSVNFPETKMFSGDIWELEQTIIDETTLQLDGEPLDFLLATPPCQGMSKNGQGKLLSEIKKGNRPKIDPRNRLIIPTMNIIMALKPKVVMFENVPEMDNTLIDDEDGNMVKIVDYIRKRLGEEYRGGAEVVEFADFGVPQRRKRLITVFSREPKLKDYYAANGSFIPRRTHSERPGIGQSPWVTVRDAIGGLPPLDAIDKERASSALPYHYVPVLEPKKYHWIMHTPPEKGAFDNQCINPTCLWQENPTHGSLRDKEGVNKASHATPLYCVKCGELLPRPYTEVDGEKRLMKGFTSAYKRMKWDKPSSTLTTNFSYPSSDHNIHPEQHRVLSFHEAFRLHTLDIYGYEWHKAGEKEPTNSLIRDTIGESVPPLALDKIVKFVVSLSN